MNLEQRLQHAARDLREVPVVVPPLDRIASGRTRVDAMATPVLVPLLFLAGALFAIGATRSGVGQSLQGDLPAVSAPVDPSPSVTPVEARNDQEVRVAHAPSALVELQMIEEFVSRARATKPPATGVTGVVPATAPIGSPADVIGPI